MTISVVIPVYNDKRYIGACLSSLANQTVRPLEIIVVENNSSDGSIDIAKKYDVKIVDEKRQGSVFARNAGFNAAKGDVIARLDADSVAPATWLASIDKYFIEHSQTTALTGSADLYDAPLRPLANACQTFFYQYLQKMLTGKYVLWGSNMSIRRKAWGQVEPLTSKRTDIDEDIDLTFVLNGQKMKIAFSRELRMGASLRRQQLGFAESVRYLATWPRDYALHKMYTRSLIIWLIVGLMIIATSPITITHSLKSRR